MFRIPECPCFFLAVTFRPAGVPARPPIASYTLLNRWGINSVVDVVDYCTGSGGSGG